MAVCHITIQSPPPFLNGKFSNYHLTLKVTAWCRRFITNLKAHSNQLDKILTSTLNATELRAAEHLLFKQSQSLSFEHEVHQLQSVHPISNKSKIISLSPFLCSDGLLRVGGRLSRANLSLSQTHPIVLYHKCSLVLSLFKYNHVTLGHCGPTLLLASVGTRLHVVGARSARTVCRSCITCRRQSAHSESQMMGQVPSQRMTQHHPFEIVGVDYAGPLTIKKGHTRKSVLIKAYLAIFVCFATKAVHLEVIEDLSTEDFISGLKRFIARRGLPSQKIHSDNGRNFIGAKNDLHQLYQFLQSSQTNSSIANYLLTHRIDWICIPECAPHFGGLWEAVVKSTKFHLKRIAGSLSLIPRPRLQIG